MENLIGKIWGHKAFQGAAIAVVAYETGRHLFIVGSYSYNFVKEKMDERCEKKDEKAKAKKAA